RPESGAVNLRDKLARVAEGGPFEPPDVALVNRAAVELLGGATRILELGSGTGLFASLAAADGRRQLVASERDPEARAWAAQHRAASNLRFVAEPEGGPFDVVVCLELIEHLHDYGGFVAS